MKKLIFILAVMITATLGSCDYVANPNETITPVDNGNDSVEHTRRVLVEDYTGHKCPNCPQAAVVAEQLKDLYGEKVVVVAVHAGFFATPTTPAGAPAGSFQTDFRTAAGTTYNSSSYFGFSAYPSGMINRKDYDGSSSNHIKSHGDWASEVSSLLAKPPVADLTITNTYNASTRSLSITTSSQFISDTLISGTYKLVVMITQDSIINWQQDGSTFIPDYVHQHVLRDNVNGAWGDTLVAGTITPFASITKNFVYTLPTAYIGNPCDPEHCHVVAFIYNTLNYEVVQAAEAKVVH
jgi:thiol-disulfide isomerase/thioredoxin